MKKVPDELKRFDGPDETQTGSETDQAGNDQPPVDAPAPKIPE